MRYRYTVELTVDELDFSATEAEHLRAALREAAEEYATGEVKVLCEDGWCIEKNDARIRAALLNMMKGVCGKMPDAWLWTWETSLGVLLGIIIFDGMRWLINALPGLRDWLADWRLERRNRKAIRRLWRAYGRKPPHGL